MPLTPSNNKHRSVIVVQHVALQKNAACQRVKTVIWNNVEAMCCCTWRLHAAGRIALRTMRKNRANSLGQLTSHHWPSFGKGENRGSVLLWYSCFDRSILMLFLMREGFQCRISILKHCLMWLWNDINQLTFVLPFAETRSINPMWRQF